MNTNIIALLVLILTPIISSTMNSGAFVFHNSYTIFTENVASVELDHPTLNFYLKSPIVYNDLIYSVATLFHTDQSQAESNYDCVIESLQRGICVFGIGAPQYDLIGSDKNGILTINRKNTIPISNIGFIRIIDNQLLIFLRHPLRSNDGTTQTYFTLSFPTQELRQSFHDKLVLALWSGEHVKYYGE